MATKEKPTDFGRYLQQSRRDKGISLDAVSRVTRITVPCLQQIESEDLVHLPSPVYVKGFLKAYAEAVSADAKEALRRYDAGRQAFLIREPKAQLRPESPRMLPRFIVALILLAMVIVVTLYAVRTFPLYPGQEAPPAVETESAGETAPPAAEMETEDENAPTAEEEAVTASDKTAALTPEADDSQNEAAAEAKPEEKPGDAASPAKEAPSADKVMTLHIVAVAPTWMKIISDGQTPQELSLQPDDEIKLEAQNQFSLLIGNAAGIRLTLDGRPVSVPGKSGQVVTLQLP